MYEGRFKKTGKTLKKITKRKILLISWNKRMHEKRSVVEI